jgi:uncharacterized membrane protein
LRRHLSTTGLLVGTFFFALSMTPSLLPRSPFYQGLVSGLSLAAGYGIGVIGVWLWNFFELPKPRERTQRIIKITAAVIGLLSAGFFLWQSSGWQNAVRDLMGLDKDAGLEPLLIASLVILVFLLILIVARLFRWTFKFLSRKLQHIVPRRVAYVVGLIAAFALFWSMIDGVLFALILRSVDSTYELIDGLMEPEYESPTDPMKAGGPGSLLSWEQMGRQGRRFLANAPTAEQIESLTGDSAQRPIRVYVGTTAARTPDERAALVLEELKRLRAFDREVMVIITPTGTGWVDPNGVDPLEYLYRGDIASVTAQYSYLPSPFALIYKGQYGVEMGQALFRAVYGYWTGLPRDNRPRLYLYGLSLGALNSDQSFDFFDIINDPFQGGLWVGPPYRTETWRIVTKRRNPDSPAWLPTFRDGSVVRFANQHGGLDKGDSPWGSFRIAYLQYASDPFTFFDPNSYFREPDWMKEPRGHDVSRHLRWFPVVTMLQLAADMLSGPAPLGYGHEYAAAHYLESWLALTEPQGWSSDDLEKLRAFFKERDRLDNKSP